ncbi:site-specific integrase [Nonomuraea antimicrobica]
MRRRADEIPVTGQPEVTLAQAARDFLARDDLDAGTVRSYGQTLGRLCRSLGGHLPLTALTADQVTQVFATTWGGAASATWNRHRAAVRSFGAWAALDDLAAGLDRRGETRPRTETISADRLDALWQRPGLPLRERTLWRLLHESAAGVSTVLSLNVEDLDLDDRRARVGGTWVSWRSETARLLPRLVAGRTRGPVFLADRRPGPARTPAPADLCPETGRRRLSYERAQYLFKQATKSLDPAGDGYTLRQLKPLPTRGQDGPATIRALPHSTPLPFQADQAVRRRGSRPRVREQRPGWVSSHCFGRSWAVSTDARRWASVRVRWKPESWCCEGAVTVAVAEHSRQAVPVDRPWR